MTTTIKSVKHEITEQDRLLTLKTIGDRKTPELQREVDMILDKVLSGTATPEERRRAAVLAAVINDRTSRV